MPKGERPHNMKSLEEMMGNLSINRSQIQKPKHIRPRDRAKKSGLDDMSSLLRALDPKTNEQKFKESLADHNKKYASTGRRIVMKSRGTSPVDKCAGKKCISEKICNPKTGRCVKRDGRIGKALLKKSKSKHMEWKC